MANPTPQRIKPYVAPQDPNAGIAAVNPMMGISSWPVTPAQQPGGNSAYPPSGMDIQFARSRGLMGGGAPGMPAIPGGGGGGAPSMQSAGFTGGGGGGAFGSASVSGTNLPAGLGPLNESLQGLPQQPQQGTLDLYNRGLQVAQQQPQYLTQHPGLNQAMATFERTMGDAKANAARNAALRGQLQGMSGAADAGQRNLDLQRSRGSAGLQAEYGKKLFDINQQLQQQKWNQMQEMLGQGRNITSDYFNMLKAASPNYSMSGALGSGGGGASGKSLSNDEIARNAYFEGGGDRGAGGGTAPIIYPSGSKQIANPASENVEPVAGPRTGSGAVYADDVPWRQLRDNYRLRPGMGQSTSSTKITKGESTPNVSPNQGMIDWQKQIQDLFGAGASRGGGGGNNTARYPSGGGGGGGLDTSAGNPAEAKASDVVTNEGGESTGMSDPNWGGWKKLDDEMFKPPEKSSAPATPAA